MTRTPFGLARVPGWVVVLLAVAAFLAVYLPRIDYVAGLIVDDAWYVLLARTLAAGEGYHLANAPVPGLLPSNPPGFPALLSIGFILNPEFPRNVPLLKSFSIAAMLAVGFLSYRYFTCYRATPPLLAACLASAIVITPAFVFLATSTVMSECVFTLAQLATVVLVDKSGTRDSGRRTILLAGAVAAGAVLLRSAGAPLAVAAAVYLLVKRRRQNALLFCGALLLCLTPWVWFARAHAPTMPERLAHGGAHALSYSDQLWMKRAGDPSLGTITARELPTRVKDGLVDVFGRDVAAIVMPALFRDGRESGMEVFAVAGGPFQGNMGNAAGTMVVSLVLSGIAVLGFVRVVRAGPTTAEFLVPLSIGMILLWPFPAIRFVVPLTPFLFFYLLRGIQALTSSPSVSRIAILCVIGLNLADHSQYALARRAGTDAWAAEAGEVDGVLNWMTENLSSQGYVATTNPALVFLRTGRHTVAIDEPRANWSRWKHLGVRYLVCLRPGRLPSASIPYRVLYRSTVQELWVVGM